MKRVFSPEMWPEGVTVRPFRPARTTSSGRNNHTRLQPRIKVRENLPLGIKLNKITLRIIT